MKKIISLFMILFLLYCGTKLLYTEDEQCLELCKEKYEDVVSAEWQGNDEYLAQIRCKCYTVDNVYFERFDKWKRK